MTTIYTYNEDNYETAQEAKASGALYEAELDGGYMNIDEEEYRAMLLNAERGAKMASKCIGGANIQVVIKHPRTGDFVSIKEFNEFSASM